MKSFKEQYQDALALEEKYRSAPRSGWVEKGSRKKANQAICVGRMEVKELARDLSSALYGEHHIMKELSGIEADKFDYTGTPDQNYRKNMAIEFQRDCKTGKKIWEINAALRFGHIEEFEDGEEY